jgi:hypothetical protein
MSEQDRATERPPERRGQSLGWVHRFRVTPGVLLLVLVGVVALGYFLERSGLWLVLFP